MVQVTVAGVHGEERPTVGQGVVSQVGQRAVQLLLDQVGALLRGGGWLLAQLARGGARRRVVGAEGIAPLAVVVRRHRTLIFCEDMEEGQKERETE